MGEFSDISDGHHTFKELYEHRLALTAALTRLIPLACWRSKAHNPEDDEMFDGFFIVGIELPAGTITYHYKLEHWDKFDYVKTLMFAPKWDGATPNDTVTRLLDVPVYPRGNHGQY